MVFSGTFSNLRPYFWGLKSKKLHIFSISALEKKSHFSTPWISPKSRENPCWSRYMVFTDPQVKRKCIWSFPTKRTDFEETVLSRWKVFLLENFTIESLHLVVSKALRKIAKMLKITFSFVFQCRYNYTDTDLPPRLSVTKTGNQKVKGVHIHLVRGLWSCCNQFEGKRRNYASKTYI